VRGVPQHAATLEGVRVAFCSATCREIAERIRDDGLLEFYRFRAGPTLPAAPATARWATYDRPALQQEFVTTLRDGTREAQLLAGGVRCAACAWLIERAMSGVAGVREIAVDPLTTRLRLRWDPQQARLGELLARIAALGYDPCPFTRDEADRAALLERRRALRRLVIAGLGMSEVMSYATAMYAGALDDMEPAIRQFLRLVSLLVATPVVFYAGAPFFAGAWRGLARRSPGMDLPVALAIAAAYAASAWNTFAGRGEVYFDSAVMFVFFLSCARFLEMSGRQRALGLSGALARHLPRVALRLVDGRTEAVGLGELERGDVIVVQPGQAVPVDGTLASGSARVDESLLTGESQPVRKAAGETVLAGSINLLGAATLTVAETGAGTVLARIGRLIAVARADRPRLVEITDRVGAWFVVGVLVLAAAVGAVWAVVAPGRAFEVVLAVLVVTCPCALALATPAAFTVATTALARRGVLLRRAGALETLSRVTDLVLDKTGTLTEHRAGIARIVPLGAIEAGDALALAAALESRSEHPLARAFPQPGGAAAVEDVVAVPGAGVAGRVTGEALRIGTRAFALGRQDPATGAEEPAGETQVWLGGDSGLIARFDIAEQLRPEAPAAVAALRGAGIRVSIASGDRPAPVQAVARRLGLADWQAALAPAGKLGLVRGMQAEGRIVGMVGDGINDSPVLAGADVSIAVGSGTSLAQHSADCVLMSAGLGALPEAVALARRTLHVVRQNLWWAVAYNVVAVPLAAAGVLAPWLAALGMSASSLLVTFNALRLGRGPRRAAAATTPAAATQPQAAA
jgi:Cu2+-exporting ATPase